MAWFTKERSKDDDNAADEHPADDELRSAHARLEHVLATSPTVLYNVLQSPDGGTRSVWASDNITRLLGYQAHDVREPDWWLRNVHPEDRATAARCIDEVRRRGSYAHEYRFRAADGHYRWILDELRVVAASDEAVELVGSWTDISEVRRSQLVIEESERSYRSLFDSLSELVCIVGLDGTILSVNRSLLARLGYAREELIGQTPDFLAHASEDERIPIADHFARALAGEPQRFQFRALARDGERFPIEISLVRGYYFGADAVIAVGTDISERRRTEEALSAAEAHFRRLVEYNPYAIYQIDEHGTVTAMNPAGLAILQRTADQVIGHSFEEFVPPEDLELGREALGWRTQGSPVLEFELHVVRPSGERRLVQIRATALPGPPDVVATQGVARDITEERAREEQVRLLAAALHGLDEGVTITRFDGQIVYANAAHARLLGYDPARRPLPSIFDFMAAPGEAELLRRAIDAARERGAWNGRVERRRVDGRLVPLQATIGIIQRRGDEDLIFTILRDLTDDLRLEEHLRRVERLATVGTLVSGVAHELNNPLHAISTFATLLLEEEKSPQQREDLETIRREASRAARIVSDLRLLARRTQDAAGDRRDIDLHEIVRHVLRTRQYALSTHNIEVQEELSATAPIVHASPAEMEQVLLNLVVNAEQALSRSSGAKRITVSTRVAAHRVALVVSDNGPGIRPEHLTHLFEPFFTTKAPAQGTGLGLSLAYKIILEHGGEIRAESEPGRGATFRIELPRTIDGAVPAQSPPPAHPPARALRVLVVDDEPAIRSALTRYLVRRGHATECAADGAEALRLIDADGARFDAIVSDLRMPGLGGEQLLERLRAAGQGLDRRVLFLTGDAAGGEAARILAHSDAPVIYKPIDLAELTQRIERHVEELGR